MSSEYAQRGKISRSCTPPTAKPCRSHERLFRINVRANLLQGKIMLICPTKSSAQHERTRHISTLMCCSVSLGQSKHL
jgi:hypothetical protein